MRPVHFEIHAENPDRCAEFYKEVFDWDIKKFDGPVSYWIITTGEEGTPGINGGITKRMGKNPDSKEPTPVVGYVNVIGVGDIDKVIKKIEAAGGICTFAKDKVPGVGLLAYYKDSESNIFGVLQPE